MFATIALVLVIVLVQVAQYSGHLDGTISAAITVALFTIMPFFQNRRKRNEDGQIVEVVHRSQLFGKTRRAQPFSPTGQKIFVWTLMVFGIGIIGLFGMIEWAQGNNNLDLVNQEKLKQLTKKQTAEREAFEDHNRNAVNAFKESRDLEDPAARKTKLEEALKEAESALEQADGSTKTQLLEMRTTLLYDLGRLDEAEKSFGEYVDSGGDKVDFPRALYDKELYEQSLSSLQLLLAKKRPCEAGVLELQLLFKLDQGVEASNRFFDLKGCRNKPHYDELKAQYDKFQADRQ